MKEKLNIKRSFFTVWSDGINIGGIDMKHLYAGVGSREVPERALKRIHYVSKKLNNLGFTLRSGGASGSDYAFEKFAGKNKEIYLPWKGFNDNRNG